MVKFCTYVITVLLHDILLAGFQVLQRTPNVDIFARHTHGQPNYLQIISCANIAEDYCLLIRDAM